MKKRRKFKRLKGQVITTEEIERRAHHSLKLGYKKQKWLEFCEKMIAEGLEVRVHEAVSTFSKYVTVSNPARGGNGFKVRFSNHRPNKHAESVGDSDFYVGIANHKTTTTEQAIEATLQFFKRSNGQ